MASRKIEEQIEALKALRSLGATEAASLGLRQALKSKTGIVVAKAAAVTGEMRIAELIPDLAVAFERMLEKPLRTDPQCWAKNAITKALVSLEYKESALFVRGLHHVQLEPIWNGEEDTAITLRGTCALALASVTDLPRRAIFQYLVGALTDSYQSSRPGSLERAAPIRAEAARAIAQMEGEEAALLLRLKARSGDVTASVTGQVFDSILGLEGEGAISFVAEFLRIGKIEEREEAALSLGTSRLAVAVTVLQSEWQMAAESSLRSAILRGLSASRQETALAFLLSIVSTGREHDALSALAALGLYRESNDVRTIFGAAVKARSEDLIRDAFERHFGSNSWT